jgi:hypothetical protein
LFKVTQRENKSGKGWMEDVENDMRQLNMNNTEIWASEVKQAKALRGP